MKRFSLVLLGLMACEPALPSPGPEREVGLDGGVADGGVVAKVVTRVEGDARVGRIIALDTNTFTALDLDTDSEVPFEPADWDLAFQRFHIRTRGGASGDGGVQVAPITDAGFDQVTSAPTTGWIEDLPDGADDNADIDTVFEKAAPWYSYDPESHVLSPAPTIYVVKSDQGGFFKLRIEGYYDPAGTPAHLTVRWQRL